MNVRNGPIAVAYCSVCDVSDSADAFFVKDFDGTLVCTVLRCVVCAALSVITPLGSFPSKNQTPI